MEFVAHCLGETLAYFGRCRVRWQLTVKVKYKYLIPRKQSTVLRSNLMRLYFPVDLTGNLIMIEKLVLGEI